MQSDFGKHFAQPTRRLVPELLHIFDVLEFLKAANKRLLDEIVHDDPP
jgi:hypothetical protein